MLPGLNIKKKLHKPSIVTITFTSPEIFLLALKIDDINVQYFFCC